MPKPLSFANSERHDQYVSMASKGRYLYIDQKGTRNQQIVELLIPRSLQPRKIMRLSGKVWGNDEKPIAATVVAINKRTGKRVWNSETNSQGEFTAILHEGGDYDFSVNPKRKELTFYSKQYNLDSLFTSNREELNIVLSPPQFMGHLGLPGIHFKPYSHELGQNAKYELRRLSRIMRNNPDKKFKIGLTLEGYMEDSVKAHPDLTELLVDTTWIESSMPDSIMSDTLDTDSLMAITDSLMIDSIGTHTSFARYELSYTYHNDRTLAQQESIANYLMSIGLKEEQFEFEITKNKYATLENQGPILSRVLVNLSLSD